MPIDLLENITDACPKDAALMALDIGSKTIGVALSDSGQSIAFPKETIKRTKFSRDLKVLEEIIRDYEVGGYILGFPLHMDGAEGRRCQSVRDFAAEFKNQLSPEFQKDDLWIAFYDERLSTETVRNLVDETVDISRRRAKDIGLTDKLAAQHILQGALSVIHGSRT
ncbi:MAG: Holliday junction resolvase RuvX [Alphaproteobacteria bacterium]|nr:Holliday junction resolvase RuvX [Alphaproteobacteria bacterium]